jgi:leucyl aminopeptidase
MPVPDSTLLPAGGRAKAITIDVVGRSRWPAYKSALAPVARTWVDAHGFAGDAGRHVAIPDRRGEVGRIIVGVGEAASADPFALGWLSRALPPGLYAFGEGVANPRLTALGWCLEAYHYGAYGKPAAEPASLRCPKPVDRAGILRAVEAVFLTCDLVNTPASGMGPGELEAAARALAKRFKARIRVIKGAALERGFPMIHAVGKASPRAPRLIDFTWGPAGARKVTLAGKGVCFDTGGLDIKTASGMLLMKKDMGGAATVLGLAHMIMAAKLKVRLRVLIPAVENAIAGNAFRPGDVLRSRKGITVEIGNTDAEGRLVLGDALALADEEKPDLLIDMATLTGAARVALGPDLPPFYTDDDGLAEAIASAARAENDPLWRMPFWEPYSRLFESAIAGMSNSGESGYAGSITAALFLKRFVERTKSYVHFDIFAWTPQARPGWPKGAAAQGLRALFAMIRERYAE